MDISRREALQFGDARPQHHLKSYIWNWSKDISINLRWGWRDDASIGTSHCSWYSSNPHVLFKVSAV